jgi:hypothetical protein
MQRVTVFVSPAKTTPRLSAPRSTSIRADTMLLLSHAVPMCMYCVQGGRPGLDDVSSLDATLHSNLLAVKACPSEQVEHLGLTFAAEQQLLGKVSTPCA